MESGTVLRLKVQGSSREVPRVARAVEGVRKIGNIQFVKTGIYTYDVELEDESARNALLSALLQHQLEVLEVTTEKKNLEQVFVNLVNQPAKRAGLKDLLAEMEAEDSEAETAAKTDDAAKPESDAQNQEEE